MALRLRALTLADREMRVEMRRLRGYWARFALGVLLVGAIGLTTTASLRLDAPGRFLFGSLLTLDFVAITLLGISVASGLITEEREARTMGLLRLAGFDPVRILIGKTLGSLVGAGLLLAVQVPFAMLAITLGGVSQGQITMGLTVLASYLMFVWAIGILCSCWCLRTTRAVRLATLLLLLWLSSPILAAALDVWVRWPRVMFWLGSHSVPATLTEVVATGFDATGGSRVGAVARLHLSIAAACFVLSWLVLRFAGRSDEAPAPRSIAWTLSPSGGGARPRAGLAALKWKDFRGMGGGRLGVLGRVVGYGVLAAWMLNESRGMRGFAESMLVWCAFLWPLEIGLLAARGYGSEWRNGTLPALALLPHGWGAVTVAKVRVLLRMIIPATVVGLLAFLGTMADWSRHLDELFLPMVWYFSAVLAGAATACYLSLRVRRGAMPLAVMAIWLINASITGCAATMTRGPEEGLFVLGIVSMGAMFVLMVGAAQRRLQELAGQ